MYLGYLAVGLLCASACLAHHGGPHKYTTGPYCKDDKTKTCLKYTVLKTEKDYEHRFYKKTALVFCDIALKSNKDVKAEMRKCFKELGKYIAGSNSEKRVLKNLFNEPFMIKLTSAKSLSILFPMLTKIPKPLDDSKLKLNDSLAFEIFVSKKIDSPKPFDAAKMIKEADKFQQMLGSKVHKSAPAYFLNYSSTGKEIGFMALKKSRNSPSS